MHSRKGEFYTPISFVQGKYDGWCGFGSNRAWGLSGEELEPEQSWELLKVIYPQSKPGECLYYHNIQDDISAGYYSSSPFGQVNVLSDISSKYKLSVFLGYNYAEEEMLSKIKDYVSSGGTLLISRAHFATVTDRESIMKNELNPLPFMEDNSNYVIAHVDGIEVDVCQTPSKGYEIMRSTDEGFPLMISYSIGKGKLYLLNAKAYPSHPAVKEIYSDTLKALIKMQTEKEYVYIECGNDVEFTVYDEENGTRTFYVLAVDWYNNSKLPRKATLRVCNNRIDFNIPQDKMLKICVKDSYYIIAEEDGEIIEINNGIARVQGTGVTAFIIKNGEKVIVDFSKMPIAEIEL